MPKIARPARRKSGCWTGSSGKSTLRENSTTSKDKLCSTSPISARFTGPSPRRSTYKAGWPENIFSYDGAHTMSSTEASRAAVAGTHPGSSLVRAMTRWDLTALATNGIIGAGIFGLPSSAAQMLGVSSPIAFVLCAIVVYVFVLCFAEAAGHFTETGGPYLYARTIFGPFIGFEVGWSLWL